MAVYLLCAGDVVPIVGSRVKIGFAEDVQFRIRELRAAHWDALYLVRTWEGDRLTEGWLHRRFQGRRIAREWFWFESAMLSVEPPDLRRPASDDSPVAQIIDRIGGVASISDALRIPLTTVGNWRARNSIPARHHQAVIGIAGGKITAAEIIAAHAMSRSVAA